MKTAILISGQCRTLDVCFANIQSQLLRHFPDADLWISIAAGADAEQAELFKTTGMNIRLLEVVEQPFFDERDYAQRSQGGHYHIGEGPHDKTAVQRILRQAWHLHRVFKQARESGEKYEAYVRLRPDQWFIFGVDGLPEVTSRMAILPWWGNFGGVNDRFAILGDQVAEAYCWWPCLDQLLADGCRFHPETLTKFALDRACAKIVRSPVLAATIKRDPVGKFIVRSPEILAEEIMPFVVEKKHAPQWLFSQ